MIIILICCLSLAGNSNLAENNWKFHEELLREKEKSTRYFVTALNKTGLFLELPGGYLLFFLIIAVSPSGNNDGKELYGEMY